MSRTPESNRYRTFYSVAAALCLLLLVGAFAISDRAPWAPVIMGCLAGSLLVAGIQRWLKEKKTDM
ncbi:hypothetical protein ACFYOT_31500 [Saccharothrix saharensis]|uniref:hypothetical protein n=1 Tax=Saccharothrix saharensis TaxID=571190 RepID=UPI0036B950B1